VTVVRARNIKPGFFLNEDLADIEAPWGRILFAGLWCMADREGRLKDRPRRIKAEVFPYDEKLPSVEKILTQLAAKRFILRYSTEGDKFIQINKFKSHQNPHNTERQSTIPSPPIHGELTVDSPLSNGENLADSLIHRFTDSNTPLPPKSGGVPFQKIIDAWNAHAPELLPRASLTESRKPKIKAAWKEHPDMEWFTALFADISLSSWHSHRDRWQGCSFDWILKNRTEMREKLDAIKKANGGLPAPRQDAKDPFNVPGLLKLDPNCPLCHGDWRNSKEPCSCLHPVEDDNAKPSEPKRTAPPANC